MTDPIQARINTVRSQAAKEVSGLEHARDAGAALAQLAADFRGMATLERRAAFDGLSMHPDKDVRALGAALRNLIDPITSQPY